MIKIISLTVLILACGRGEEVPEKKHDGRQKRLLFFDEEGSLVKTYANPHLRDWSVSIDNIPFYENLHPFYNYIRRAPGIGGSIATYMIPVSNEVIQQIDRDPILQNKLLISPKKEAVIEPNPLCTDKRTQIPSPMHCNNFLNCWDGWAVEQECPKGLLFSSEGYCDYADNVDCKNRKWEGPKPMPEPQCGKDFQSFRSELSCNEFYVCVARQPIRFKCPADLAYNQVLGVCDYPERVDCALYLPLGFSPSHIPAAVFPPSSDTTTSPNVSPSPSSPLPPNFPPSPSLSPSPVLPEAMSPVASESPMPVGYPMLIPKPADSGPRSTVFDSQSWITTHIAMSRQDAIRQLQLHSL